MEWSRINQPSRSVGQESSPWNSQGSISQVYQGLTFPQKPTRNQTHPQNPFFIPYTYMLTMET